MAISDETRYQLHQRLDEVLGPDEAATLMAHLPPVGWADVATKRDLDHLATVFDAKLESGLAGVRTELRTGLAELRVELHKEIGGVRQEIGSQTWTLLLGIAGLQISGVLAVVGLSSVL